MDTFVYILLGAIAMIVFAMCIWTFFFLVPRKFKEFKEQEKKEAKVVDDRVYTMNMKNKFK